MAGRRTTHSARIGPRLSAPGVRAVSAIAGRPANGSYQSSTWQSRAQAELPCSRLATTELDRVDAKNPRWVIGLVVATRASPRVFERAPQLLRGEARLLCSLAGLRRPTGAWADRGLFYESDQSLARCGAILPLRPMSPAVDQQLAIRRHPRPGEGDQPRLHIGWQRRRADVVPKLNGRRDLVDVLTTRPPRRERSAPR